VETAEELKKKGQWVAVMQFIKKLMHKQPWSAISQFHNFAIANLPKIANDYERNRKPS